MTTDEDIVRLSMDKFRGKTSQDVNRVEDLFDDGLIFVHLIGNVTSKRDWIAQMRSGRLIDKRIEPREMSARVYGRHRRAFRESNVHRGDGRGSGSYNLAFTEVYARRGGQRRDHSARPCRCSLWWQCKENITCGPTTLRPLCFLPAANWALALSPGVLWGRGFDWRGQCGSVLWGE